MPYTPDATVVTEPDGATQQASSAALEFRTIKLYLRDVLLAGLNALTASTTSALSLKAPLASPTLTGVPVAPTAALGTNTAQLATMAALQAGIANVNAQTPLVVSIEAGTAITAVSGTVHVLTAAGLSTVTMPAAPVANSKIGICIDNGRADNIINWNGQLHMNSADATMIINSSLANMTWQFVNSKWRLV